MTAVSINQHVAKELVQTNLAVTGKVLPMTMPYADSFHVSVELNNINHTNQLFLSMPKLYSSITTIQPETVFKLECKSSASYIITGFPPVFVPTSLTQLEDARKLLLATFSSVF